MLSFGGAPRRELIEVDEVEPLEQLAFEHRLEPLQALGRDVLDARFECFANAAPVEGALIELELYVLAVRDEAALFVSVDDWANLREAPAQGAAWIVGNVPQ